jgi:hypothetical protein
MTEAQKKFVELEKRKEEIKKFYEDLKLAIEAVKAEVGLNGYFQDEEGTVYKIVEPEGKFVTYDKISYVRTRRLTEKRGDLSIKEAEEAGFNVPTK